MWSVLLLILVPEGLVEAAYVYNEPNPSLGLPKDQSSDNHHLYNNQPQPFKIAHDTHEEGKSITYSISYNDYAHLKNGNIRINLANLEQFTPNNNNIYVNGNTDQSKSNIGIPTHNEQTNGVHWNNNYRTSGEYTNSLNNYNTPSHLFSPPHTESPLNQLPVITTTTVRPYSTYNNGYRATQVNQPPVSLSNVFSQAVQTSVAFNKESNQARPVLEPSNDAHNPAPLVSTGWNTEYPQPGVSSVRNNLDTGIVNNFLPGRNLQSSNVHSESFLESNNIHSQNVVQNNLNSETSPVTSNAFTNSIHRVNPRIYKHIYFHAPPPEIEEPHNPKPTSTVQKKSYKILFIKLPSQVSQSNVARVQQQIAQSAAVDVKTLIYVLVKKPDPNPKPVILSTPNRSHHQVFFVKYTGNPDDDTSTTSEVLDKPGSNMTSPTLAAGLVNGLN